MYVADTHAWVYYLLRRLPENLKEIFIKAENFEDVIFVPTIVLNEIIWMVEGGKVTLDIKAVLSRFDEATNFVIVPLDLNITKKVSELKELELHDRIITATANILNATLITKDQEIAESGYVKTVW
ncbi:MAG: PIN domain-containing protein [Candidatus Aenigmarchaeota archaeon]|nr:PIN domain-containing protein [Candidatus Aenigmarchaeota archaeon]